MSNGKVLVIDDDQNICQILKDYLEFENFEVIVAHDGQEGLRKSREENPDIIILDIMLPEMDGLEVCQQLRPQNDTPIIMLSAKNKDTDRITGLEMGADDYVTKPFSPKEVVVRVKTILRRTEKSAEYTNTISFPQLAINQDHRTVKVKGEEVELTPKEFDLLWHFASSPKQVFKRQDLLNKVWGYDYYGDIRTVDTHIKSLRDKLGEPVQNYIKTIWGVGYKFEATED
ncbi:response regulator transcription factor [Fuchsiella alkaliacetigena]|uniref:response regulator transcription factor n=1 Tax=Fuchsiella alkaliacetigena TaxID=957042 RepID=UPI00200B021F|nr:response regulator transcription factor [Fuchsiella alkaliacetigena]MCK8823717.1 response regulator transcription factor [Fuchsiella alkaliacetigena]